MSADEAAISAEVLRARAELAATVDELTTRLAPKALADDATQAAKLAAGDAGALLSGEGMPLAKNRARNVKVLLGAAAGVVVVVAVIVVKVARRR